MRVITSRWFLLIAFLVLAFLVIVTDPDFFNPLDITTFPKPHHEQLFVLMIFMGGFAVLSSNATHRGLVFVIAVAATLLAISTFIIPP
jgi:hypothetical protein